MKNEEVNNMEYNKNTDIEVGDLVRVVAHLPHDPGGFEGNDFIVEEGEGKAFLLVGANGTEWLFYPEELEIMKEKAEMESVYAEEKKLEDDQKKCYDILKDWYERKYIEPEELIKKLNGMGWDKG